jgi:hypothetical protein
VDDIVASFYEHLLRFPELAALLHENPLRLERLKVIQQAYFLDITEDRFDERYFETRLSGMPFASRPACWRSWRLCGHPGAGGGDDPTPDIPTHGKACEPGVRSRTGFGLACALEHRFPCSSAIPCNEKCDAQDQ